MSDQDDVWFGDKINRMIAVLEENNADLAVHDGYITNQQLEPRLETMFQLANSCCSVLPVRIGVQKQTVHFV